MSAIPYDLTGKTAVVTGAGRGIGRAIAVGYARAGARVCCSARTESEIHDAARQIQNEGGEAMAVVADVARLESVNELMKETADGFGGIDIVVGNAGAASNHSSVEEGRAEEWQSIIDVNLTGAYYTAKAAIPHLRRRGAGKIIYVGSGMGHRGLANGSAYACAKAGVWMLTRILAQELAEDNISVNELIPGPVMTSMMRGGAEDFLNRVGRTEWVKQPEDVVPLALFLAAQPDKGPSAQSFSLMRRNP